MSIIKVRHYGNNGMVTIPADVLQRANLATGDYVQIEVDGATRRLTLTPIRIEPRAHPDIREIGLQVIEDDQEFLDRLAAHDTDEAP